MVDPDSPGRRWYRRSDGSHQYIIGNTHYSFLSGYRDGDRPSGNDIAQDVARNAEYFKKLRFGLHGDRYPHPTEKPFLDDEGRPTDDGDFSHRPNPAWFHERVGRGGADGLRPRPDRRPDPLPAPTPRSPARRSGRAATAATRRRT